MSSSKRSAEGSANSLCNRHGVLSHFETTTEADRMRAYGLGPERMFLSCVLARRLGSRPRRETSSHVERRITTPRCRGALVSPRRLPRSLVRIICPRPRLSSSYTRIRFRRTRRTQRLNEGGEGRFRSGPPGRRGRLRGTRDAMYKEDWYAPPPVSRFKHVSSRESTISTISG